MIGFWDQWEPDILRNRHADRTLQTCRPTERFGSIGEHIVDITSDVTASWLNDSVLLELAFAFSPTANPNIPGRHIHTFYG